MHSKHYELKNQNTYVLKLVVVMKKGRRTEPIWKILHGVLIVDTKIRIDI